MAYWEGGPKPKIIETREFVASLPTKLTDARIEALKRSKLVHAFHANAPDTRKLGKEKRAAVIDQFLKSKRWQKIAKEILEE